MEDLMFFLARLIVGMAIGLGGLAVMFLWWVL